MSYKNDLEKTNCIYVVFTSTPCKVGKLIRFVTRHQYNHVSISLEKDLRHMYSFARYCNDTPLVGGFVEESSLRYYCNSDTVVPVKICEIPLTLDEYNTVVNCIYDIKHNSKDYLYNLFAAATFPLHRKVQLNKAFTCLEFGLYVLSKCHLRNEINLNKFYTIEDLENMLSKYTTYEGNMSEFAQFEDWGNDNFLNKQNSIEICTSTIKQFGNLINRKISG